MGVDLLREYLGTLAVQSSRQRFARNLTPHPCIVAHGPAARKDSRNLAPNEIAGNLFAPTTDL